MCYTNLFGPALAFFIALLRGLLGIKGGNRLGHHVLIDVHVLHGGRTLRVAQQLLQHLHRAPMPDELGGKRLAADVVVQARFDAQLQADGCEPSVFILVGVVGKPAGALLLLRVLDAGQRLEISWSVNGKQWGR